MKPVAYRGRKVVFMKLTQEVNLSRVLSHKVRDKVLSCVVCAESHEHELKQ